MRKITLGIDGSYRLGNLIFKDNTISTVENYRDLKIDLGSSESVFVQNDFAVADSSLRFYNDSNNYVALTAPASISQDVIYTLPDEQNLSSGNLLETDTTGTLSWKTAALSTSDQEVDTDSYFPLLTTQSSGTVNQVSVSTSKLSFVPNTGTLSSVEFAAEFVSSNATISGGTIDNTEIGLNTPDALDTASVQVENGSQADPSVYFNSSTGTGFWADGNLNVVGDNSNLLSLDNSDNVALSSIASFQNGGTLTADIVRKLDDPGDWTHTIYGDTEVNINANQNSRVFLSKQINITDDTDPVYLLGKVDVRTNVQGTIVYQRSTGYSGGGQITFGLSTDSRGLDDNGVFISAYEGDNRSRQWKMVIAQYEGEDWYGIVHEGSNVYLSSFAYFYGMIDTSEMDLFLVPQTGLSYTEMSYSTNMVNRVNTFQITGNLSKSSGSFKIDHPLPDKQDTHYLVHSFTESPGADLIYSGMVKLDQGRATVNIDSEAGMTQGTFQALCRDVRYFASNESGFSDVKATYNKNQLQIQAESAVNDTVYWQVIGERQDREIRQSSATDDNGRFIIEPEKNIIEDADDSLV